jgi:hypothetical protein
MINKKELLGEVIEIHKSLDEEIRAFYNELNQIEYATEKKAATLILTVEVLKTSLLMIMANRKAMAAAAFSDEMLKDLIERGVSDHCLRLIIVTQDMMKDPE